MLRMTVHASADYITIRSVSKVQPTFNPKVLAPTSALALTTKTFVNSASSKRLVLCLRSSRSKKR